MTRFIGAALMLEPLLGEERTQAPPSSRRSVLPGDVV
jgi:hypothetical protein